MSSGGKGVIGLALALLVVGFLAPGGWMVLLIFLGGTLLVGALALGARGEEGHPPGRLP
ncbi:hypothetical protein ABT354_10795 [Streptomyces sp. NPDC000594]|uniref:hypothetical protein n=1 Tax=Streptomyces sp. NPDC000594 TaxID=3154261 RepID=UPI0033301CDC